MFLALMAIMMLQRICHRLFKINQDKVSELQRKDIDAQFFHTARSHNLLSVPASLQIVTSETLRPNFRVQRELTRYSLSQETVSL